MKQLVTKKLSMRQLAELCGVSVATVSRALSDKSRVNPLLREKILRYAREHGYFWKISMPHPGIIGIILPSENLELGKYTWILLEALKKEMALRGIRSVIIFRENIMVLNEIFISGAVSFDFHDTISQSWPNLKNIPLVCLNDSGQSYESIYSVQSNTAQGVRQGVEHLVNLGHRKIGMLHLYLPDHSRHEMGREVEFVKLSQAGEFSFEAIIQNFNFTDLPLHEAMGLLLAKEITAVLVPGEGYAGKALRSLRIYGKKVPEDISLITWEIPRESENFYPRLTTLAQDFDGIAGIALDILEDQIAGRKVHNAVLDYQLIQRESTTFLQDSLNSI